MYLDILSDLHIDQWDTSIGIKYPCGSISNYPFKFKSSKSKILIVAGDISDDIELSLHYLDKISGKYDKILFVDGNHEHINEYPNLICVDSIFNKLKKKKNNKLVYLSKTPFKIDDTMIIGCCGWWNYSKSSKKIDKADNKFKSENIIKDLTYFDNWMPHLDLDDTEKFIYNVLQRANDEYEYLNILLESYSNDSEINKIIVVTHTIPSDMFLINEDISCLVNTKLMKLIDKYSKISHWIFGHTHNFYEFKHKGVHFICNPRGRPEDFNRELFNIKTIKL